MTELILASASPRRSQMLRDMGVPFRVIVSDADENVHESDPEAFCLAVAMKKAEAVLPHAPKGAVVIACDTVVVMGDIILGKPADRADARRMLSSLSGKEHRVISALCVTNGEKTIRKASVTKVLFRELSDNEIDAYIATGECDDKAGSYGIQGLGGLFVSGICGDWQTVVGMPLTMLYEILKNEFDFDMLAFRREENV